MPIDVVQVFFAALFAVVIGNIITFFIMNWLSEDDEKETNNE